MKPKGFIPIVVVIFIALVAATMVGAGLYYKSKGGPAKISTFEQCVAAGNPVMESYPRQCRVNGQTFVEVVANNNHAVNVNTAVNTNLNTNPLAGKDVYTSKLGFYIVMPTEWAGYKPVDGDNSVTIHSTWDALYFTITKSTQVTMAGAEKIGTDGTNNFFFVSSSTTPPAGYAAAAKQQFSVAAQEMTAIKQSFALATAAMLNTNTSVVTNNTDNDTTADEIAGWKTYTNTDYQYTLKYPQTWTYQETSIAKADSSFGVPVKYVSFYSPNKNYILTLGIRLSGEDVRISARTGTGAGDIVASDQNIKIDGSSTLTSRLISNNKVKIVFYYPKDSSLVQIGGHDITAEISSNKIAYDALDVVNANEYLTANLMLSTLTLKDLTAGWKTYTNSKYNFSFKYPAEDQIIDPCGTTGSLVTTCVSVRTGYSQARNANLDVAVFVQPSTDIVSAGWFSAVETVSDTKKTVNSIEWREIDTKGGPGPNQSDRTGHTAFVVKSGQTYQVAVTLFPDAEYNGLSDLYQNILSTFTFTK